MKVSIITPSYNSARFLADTRESILRQREEGVDLEWIVVDGASTDDTPRLLEAYEADIDVCIREPDKGPASAINKGFQHTTGELVAWINADDFYQHGALRRTCRAAEAYPHASFFFGACPIVDEEGREIRSFITRFKAAFFPLNSRWVFQCINYISQPSCVFRRTAWENAGPLREDLTAAWDYEFLLRMWRQGAGRRIPGEPIAAFRWHPGSISGSSFQRQFDEEFEAAAADAGRYSLQTLLHRGVRWGIVTAYRRMARKRENGS